MIKKMLGIEKISCIFKCGGGGDWRDEEPCGISYSSNCGCMVFIVVGLSSIVILYSAVKILTSI